MRGVERKAFMARRLCGGADCSPHGSWETEREVDKDRETETYRRETERQNRKGSTDKTIPLKALPQRPTLPNQTQPAVNQVSNT